MKTTLIILTLLTVGLASAGPLFAQSKDSSLQKTKRNAAPARPGKAGKPASFSPASTGSTPTSNDIHVKTTKASTANVPATAPATPPQKTIVPGKKERSKTGSSKKTLAAKNKKTTDKKVQDQ